MKSPIIVSVVNHKGGCLKTTVTVNLGAALARAGKKTLVIDLDAQQNLTSSLVGSQEPKEGVPTLYDCICDELGLDHLIMETSTAGLDVIPCTEDFMGADLTLVSAVGRESMLTACLKNTSRLSDYDIVLMDNSPSISLVVMNSLVASDYFLVPCSAEYLPMLGLSLLGAHRTHGETSSQTPVPRRRPNDVFTKRANLPHGREHASKGTWGDAL